MSERKFNLDDYVPVQERITQFWTRFPEGRIETEHIGEIGDVVAFRALVYRASGDVKPAATGYAQETRGDGYVNKTSHVENCETSAIGRALANLGFATSMKDRPSREEMAKAQRTENHVAERVRIGEAIMEACRGDANLASWRLQLYCGKKSVRDLTSEEISTLAALLDSGSPEFAASFAVTPKLNDDDIPK